MSAKGQLRFVVVAFFVVGGLNLIVAAVQLGLGQTPRLPPIIGGALYVLGAWQLWRGAVVAHFGLAAMSVLAAVLCVLFASLMVREAEAFSVLLFLFGALFAVCAGLLLFSRPLRAELKARRLLNHEAGRVAYQKYLSELDQP
jgi:hypothetical protein